MAGYPGVQVLTAAAGEEAGATLTLDDAIARRLDHLALRGPLVLVPVLCTLLMVIEGMDSNVIGYIGPLLRRELGLSTTMLGVIYTATVVASLLGAAGIAPLSDRIGRRPILIGSSLACGLGTLAIPLIAQPWGLVVARFVIGVAFGAAVPSAFALTADYAPARRRAVLVMIVTSGVACGYVLAGFAAAAVIPAFGWRPLMDSLGLFSLAASLVFYFLLPESPQFLVRARPDAAVTGALAGRLGLDLAGLRGGGAAPRPRTSPAQLVSPGRRVTTALVGFAVASVYAVELMVAFWLPTMLVDAGHSVGGAATIAATGKIASIAGCVAGGWLMDRTGVVRTLGGGYLLCALAFCALSVTFAAPALLVPTVMLACFFLDGSFSGAQALTVTSYPTALRATASGWITGFARLLGGGLGTMAGGALIGWGMTMGAITLVMMAVMAAGGVALLLLGRLRRG